MVWGSAPGNELSERRAAAQVADMTGGCVDGVAYVVPTWEVLPQLLVVIIVFVLLLLTLVPQLLVTALETDMCANALPCC